MQKPLTNEQRLQQGRNYYRQIINQIKPRAYSLNIKLASNPFIKNQDKFQFIIYNLSEYNKRVQKQLVVDPYQMISYHKLHSMVSDLAQIQTKKDQLQALSQVHAWFKDQHKLVEQRRDQGQIRYLMNNDYRKIMSMPIGQKKQNQQTKQQKKYEIPTELIDRLMEPYKNNNRTSHKQLDIPLRRLNQYKRKVINIAPFIQNKQSEKPKRVLYPVPPKYEPPKEEEDQNKQGAQGHQVKQGQQGQPPVQGAQVPVQGQKKQEETGQPEQDLGGFGQQPQQPEEQEPPEDTQDKLAPKNKIYTAAISDIKLKEYRGQYMSYRGRQNLSERSLQQRYLKLQEQIIGKQRQDKINIQLANQRAKKKSKMQKQLQKKLQEMMHKPSYLFSQQEAAKEERLSKDDQIKYGFTTNLRAKPKYSEFDMTNHTTLPRINDQNQMYEKSIRRDRINSLKLKFSKLLNLTQYQQRQSVASICQYTSRKRGFSEIIKHHSKSKQRLNQLQQVTKIKQKLTKNKIGVNIRALSQGLCLPDKEENQLNSMFANKQLPSNPFMVETKKKKKKK